MVENDVKSRTKWFSNILDLPLRYPIEKNGKIEKKFVLIFWPPWGGGYQPFGARFLENEKEIWKSPRWHKLYEPRLQNGTAYDPNALLVWPVGGGPTPFHDSSSCKSSPSVFVVFSFPSNFLHKCDIPQTHIWSIHCF